MVFTPHEYQKYTIDFTIDEKIMAVLQRKNKTQNALIDAVKAELKGA